MAITIGNVNSNISDDVLSYRLTFSGKTQPNAIGRIKVNGTTIGSAWWTTSSYIDVTFTAAALYNAAKDHSPTNAVIFEVQEADADFILVGSASQRVDGDITITRRIAVTSWTSPTTANPIDLDLANPTNVAASWSRPENNSAFFGRMKFYVWNGTSYTLIFNYSPNATSLSIDIPTQSLVDACVAAMNGGSPRKIKIEVITVFKFASYTDLSGVSGTKEVTDGIIKSFYDGSRVGIYDGAAWGDHEAFVHDGASWKSSQVYVYNGSNWVESL